MPPEADQAAGFWYASLDAAGPSPVEVLDALRRYRAAEQAMRRRTRAWMGMGETDLVAVRYLLDAQRTEHVVTAKDLARHLEISSASTTVLVDRLIRSGHVVRSEHPTDRRAIVVTATPSAEREVRATLGRMHRGMMEAAEDLDPEERAVVLAFLERMRLVVDGAGPEVGATTGTSAATTR
jgi:DNA-binding MarR family transcriptional regulator